MNAESTPPAQVSDSLGPDVGGVTLKAVGIADLFPDGIITDANATREITFGDLNKRKGLPESRHKFPFVEGERFGAPLINHPWGDARELLPTAQRFVDLLASGQVTTKPISPDEEKNPYIIEDDLVAQGVGTTLIARLAHRTVDGEPGEFDGCFVAGEASHERPLYLLTPERVVPKKESDRPGY